MASIIEVARALRAPCEDVDAERLIIALATTQIDDVPPVTIRRFIGQALAHQPLVKDSDDSKVFPAKIVEVKRISRDANGRNLGHKAHIVLETADGSGGTQTEEIDTGWVEFLGESDPGAVRDQRLVWEIALARSIEEDAKRLTGRHVFLRKVVLKASGNSQNRVRFVADIEPDFRDQGEGGDQAPRRTSEKRDSRGAGDRVTENAIKDACGAMKVDFGKDMLDLLEVTEWSGKASAVGEHVAGVARIPKKEIDEFVDVFVDTDGSMLERAVVALDEWR